MTQLSTSPASTRTVSPGWRVWNLAGVAALTAYSTGIAWQAQFVSYPLYRAVSEEEFPAYHLAYNHAIPGVVIIPGFLGFLACAAFPWTRPAGVPRLAATLVAVSGVGSVLSTVLWAIPRHDLLDRIGQDEATISSLIQANGVRTALLTLGAVALSWSLVRLVRR
jgi:small-conductance mechanosensitive channel